MTGLRVKDCGYRGADDITFHRRHDERRLEDTGRHANYGLYGRVWVRLCPKSGREIDGQMNQTRHTSNVSLLLSTKGRFYPEEKEFKHRYGWDL